jgi:hypothetical protein
MSDLDKAAATQLRNIETKTGKSSAQLIAEVRKCGLSKHAEMRTWAMETFGIGHGDANLVVHLARSNETANTQSDAQDVLSEIYAGKKTHLRPIHEKLMRSIETFGAFEVAPKKGYVSLRRKKQFAMLGPKTNDRFELGLNLKEDIVDARAEAQPPGGMCQYIVALTSADEVDDRLIARA